MKCEVKCDIKIRESGASRGVKMLRDKWGG